MLAVLELAGALLLVVVAADAFTNAIEWIDARTGLTSSAAGAVVAAIGSSLPETIVAFIALVLLHDQRSQAIGVGTVIGAPFMLGTAIFSLIGILAFVRRSAGDKAELAIPVAPTIFGAALFFATFALALAASFTRARLAHEAAALLVVCAYGAYLYYHLRVVEPEAEESPPPLRIAPASKEPPMGLVVVQLCIALALTALASRWLVASLAQASLIFGISPFIIALFLSPIATELPEASSVVLWLRRGEDTLAMNNVLGAMMFRDLDRLCHRDAGHAVAAPHERLCGWGHRACLRGRARHRDGRSAACRTSGAGRRGAVLSGVRGGDGVRAAPLAERRRTYFRRYCGNE